jgi:hypothetical protein
MVSRFASQHWKVIKHLIKFRKGNVDGDGVTPDSVVGSRLTVISD